MKLLENVLAAERLPSSLFGRIGAQSLDFTLQELPALLDESLQLRDLGVNIRIRSRPFGPITRRIARYFPFESFQNRKQFLLGEFFVQQCGQPIQQPRA